MRGAKVTKSAKTIGWIKDRCESTNSAITASHHEAKIAFPAGCVLYFLPMCHLSSKIPPWHNH